MGYGKVNAYNALIQVYNNIDFVITHIPIGNTENITGPYIVNAHITSVFGAIDPSKTKLFWTRGVTFDSVPMTNSGGNNWIANIPGNGSPANYKYYVKATDITGVERTLPYNAPNNYFSFTAFSNPSEILISPLNNSVNNPIPLVLNWRRVLGATKYLLQVAEDSLLNNLIVNDSTLIDTSKSISQLDTNTKYYWKVTAKDNSGSFLSSSIWNFITSGNNLATPTYDLVARNFSLEDSLADDDMIKFDIYIQHTNYPVPFQYAGGQYFFSFNNAIATNNADLQYSIIGSDLPANMQPRNPVVGTAANPTANVLRLLVNIFPGVGNGYIMTNNGSPGTKIVRMRLRRISGTFNTQYLGLIWRNPPITSQFTRISAYIGSILTDVTTFSSHSIDSSGGVLPVELASFTSSVNRNNVMLDWFTTRETNNSGFDIERSIVNGEWSKVGNVAGNGTTTKPHSYSFIDKGLNSGKYNYRLKQIDFNGHYEYFDLRNEINVGVPAKYSLSQNYPNPFNPSTKIDYELPYDGSVNIKLYDVSGREVATLVDEVKTAGYYTLQFNASNLASGAYFYRIESGEFRDIKRMILIK